MQAGLEYYVDNSLGFIGAGVVQGLAPLALAWVVTFLAATRARRPEFPRPAVYVGLVGAVLLGLATMLLPIDRVIAFNDFLDSERTVDDARSLGGSLSLTAELLAYVGQFMLAAGMLLVSLNAMRAGPADALPRHPRGDQRRPLRVPAADAAARRAGVLAHRARADAARRRPHPAPPAWRTGNAEPGRAPRRPPPAAARPRSGARGSGPNRSPSPRACPGARTPRRRSASASGATSTGAGGHRRPHVLANDGTRPLRLRAARARRRRPGPRARRHRDRVRPIPWSSGDPGAHGPADHRLLVRFDPEAETLRRVHRQQLGVGVAATVPVAERHEDHDGEGDRHGQHGELREQRVLTGCPPSMASPAKIAPVATAAPVTRPIAAPLSSPSHQIPSSRRAERARGQREAQPTSTEMSSPRGQRERHRRQHPAEGREPEAPPPRPDVRWPAPPQVEGDRPATETISPEAVDMKAANAPAATSAPSSSPPRPGHATSGRRSTTESVSPVMYSSGSAAERAVDERERVEDREQPEHAHGRAAGRAVGVV